MHRAARLVLWGALAAAPSAQALTFTDLVLAAIAPNSSLVSYTDSADPSFVMTVTETTTATMAGSDLFDFEGLWLGSDGSGGRYTVSFSRPVSSFSLSFIALTNFGAGTAETLTSFVSSTASSAGFVSADGSASWNGSTVSPLDEDSRGVITFNASVLPFASIRFDHLQTVQLQGFIIDRIEVTPAPVPEPVTALMFCVGLLSLWGLRRSAALRQGREAEGGMS